MTENRFIEFITNEILKILFTFKESTLMVYYLIGSIKGNAV